MRTSGSGRPRRGRRRRRAVEGRCGRRSSDSSRPRAGWTRPRGCTMTAMTERENPGTGGVAGGGRPRGQREVQRTGTWIAAGVGVAFVGVLGWYMLHGGGGPPAGGPVPEGPRAKPAGMKEPADLDIGDGQQIEIPLMDRKDLRRQVGLVKIDSTEPLESGHVAAVKPEAWLYLEDGRTLHIAAPEGKLYMPDRGKEPESGTLSGGVIADLYEAHEDGSRAVVGTDHPTVTFSVPSLTFDSLLGKGSTTERWTITGDRKST